MFYFISEMKNARKNWLVKRFEIKCHFIAISFIKIAEREQKYNITS